MKVLVVIFALCVAATFGGLTDEQKAKLKTYKESCIAETSVDPALIENAKNGQIAESDEKLNCFAACLLKHIGVLDAEGNIHEEVARAKIPSDIPQDKVDLVINRCKVLRGDSVCQTGGKVFACFLKTKTFPLF